MSNFKELREPVNPFRGLSRDVYELEDSTDYTLSEWGDEAEMYAMPRHRTWDTAFQMQDDTGKEPQSSGVPEATLDNLDGDLSEYGSEKYPSKTNDMPVLRSQYDYAEWYDLIDTHQAYKKASVDFRKGDWVEIIRPHRYYVKGGRRARVGVIINASPNGWLTIKPLRGKPIAVYAGLSELDCDVAKIDLEKFAKSQGIKIAVNTMSDKELATIADLMHSVFNNVDTVYSDAIDQKYVDYLLQNQQEY